MSGFSSRHTFNQVSDSSHPPLLNAAFFAAFFHYLVGGAVVWLIGIQFTAGFHFATAGSANYAASFFDGAALVVVAATVALVSRLEKVHVEGIENGVALALGTILIVASFPIGAILGCGWNAIAGAFPDMSGVGNRMIDMIRVSTLR
jgi:hypothetical protein